MKEENWAGTEALQGAEGDVRPPPRLSGGCWEPTGVLALAVHPVGLGRWKAVTKVAFEGDVCVRAS